MTKLALPCIADVSCSWQCHLDRNPPSSEPGTDYACPHNTPISAAESGYITDIQSHNSNATGRYVTLVLLNGWTVRYLHLQRLLVGVGDYVRRGQVLAYSGGSGFGSDYYYGAHVHTTLWLGTIWSIPTSDFERYVGSNPEPEPEEEMAIMRGATYTRASDNVKVRLLFNETSGWYSEVSQIEGDYVNSIANNWETNSWPDITESHANAIKRDLDKHASKTSLSAVKWPAWAIAAALFVLAIVQVVVNNT